jgi:hypothetical protein
LKLSRKLQPMATYLNSPSPTTTGPVSTANAPIARQSRRRGGFFAAPAGGAAGAAPQAGLAPGWGHGPAPK